MGKYWKRWNPRREPQWISPQEGRRRVEEFEREFMSGKGVEGEEVGKNFVALGEEGERTAETIEAMDNKGTRI